MNFYTVNMEITAFELHKLLQQAAYEGARKLAEELDIIKTTISRNEVIKLYGRTVYEHSISFVKWQKKGTGTNSPAMCNREEFMAYLRTFDCEIN